MISLHDILKHKAQLFFTPKWLTRVTHIAPTTSINWLVTQHLNKVFETHIAEGELDFLADKQLCIEVNNLPLTLLISLEPTSKKLQVYVIKQDQLPVKSIKYDGKLTGSSDTFLCLISGKHDPDTLFFSRKLTIQGDTELCLTVKNWLDTQEPHNSLPTWLFNELTHYIETLP